MRGTDAIAVNNVSGKYSAPVMLHDSLGLMPGAVKTLTNIYDD